MPLLRSFSGVLKKLKCYKKTKALTLHNSVTDIARAEGPGYRRYYDSSPKGENRT
jgi:hypothetical protein